MIPEQSILEDVVSTYAQMLANAQRQAITAQVELEYARRRIQELEAAVSAAEASDNTDDPAAPVAGSDTATEDQAAPAARSTE